MVTWVQRLGYMFIYHLLLHFEEFDLGTDEGKAMVSAEAALQEGKNGKLREGQERSQSSESFRDSSFLHSLRQS